MVLITIRSLINKIKIRFQSDNIIRGFVSILSGSLLGQVLVLASTPVITRLYSPSDLGIFSLYLAVVSIATGISTLKYEYAIPLPKDDKDAVNLVVLCLICVILSSVIGIVALMILIPCLNNIIRLSPLSSYIWLIILSSLCGGMYSSLNYWAIREKCYSEIAKNSFLQCFTGSSAKISLGLCGLSPLGLFIGDSLSRFIGFFSFFKKFYRKKVTLIQKISLYSIILVAKKYSRFPLYSCPSSVINGLASQMPTLMLISFYGSEITGYYGLAFGVMVFPASIISNAIGQIYLGEIAELFHTDPQYVRRIYRSLIFKLALFSIPVILLIAILAPSLFPLVFGEIWQEAGYYCIAMASAVISQFIFSTTSILHYCGKNNWVFLFDITRTAGVFCVFILCTFLNYSAFITLFMYSGMITLMYIFNFFLNLRAISSLIKPNLVRLH